MVSAGRRPATDAATSPDRFRGEILGFLGANLLDQCVQLSFLRFGGGIGAKLGEHAIVGVLVVGAERVGGLRRCFTKLTK